MKQESAQIGVEEMPGRLGGVPLFPSLPKSSKLFQRHNQCQSCPKKIVLTLEEMDADLGGRGIGGGLHGLRADGFLTLTQLFQSLPKSSSLFIVSTRH